MGDGGEEQELRRSASIQPHIVAALFPGSSAQWSAPLVLQRIELGGPHERRDGSGQRFTSYPVSALCTDGTAIRTERRYTDFVALHQEIQVILGLPTIFPVTASNGLVSWIGGGTLRHVQLQEYLNAVLLAAPQRPVPTLVAFCRMAAYVAVSSDRKSVV